MQAKIIHLPITHTKNPRQIRNHATQATFPVVEIDLSALLRESLKRIANEKCKAALRAELNLPPAA